VELARKLKETVEDRTSPTMAPAFKALKDWLEAHE
jgi:hypothetical protein